MSNFINAMSDLFSFLFTQLGNMSTWFLNNLLGQIILGVLIFTFIVSLFGYILSKMRR